MVGKQKSGHCQRVMVKNDADQSPQLLKEFTMFWVTNCSSQSLENASFSQTSYLAAHGENANGGSFSKTSYTWSSCYYVVVVLFVYKIWNKNDCYSASVLKQDPNTWKVQKSKDC